MMNDNMLVDPYVGFLNSFARIKNMFMNWSQTYIVKVTCLFYKLWKSQQIEYIIHVRVRIVHNTRTGTR